MASSYYWFDLLDEESDFDSFSSSESSSSSEYETDEEEDVYLYLPSLSDVEIDRQYVHVKQKLGEGFFGTVYRGKLKKDNLSLSVAIKTLKQGVMTTEKFLDEARTMRTLAHNNLVELIGVCRKEEPLLIITEYMCNGDLHRFLRKDKGSTIEIRQLSYFASQIADGMDYLESEVFVHRDLRCANVLVGKEHLVKIADFGLARLVDDYDQYIGGAASAFPVLWTAPEARYYEIFTIQSDVWSFGVLLYEMITYGAKPKRNMKAVVQKPKPANWPKGYFMYMGACLNDDPDQRPTFSDLHNFFEDYRKK